MSYISFLSSLVPSLSFECRSKYKVVVFSGTSQTRARNFRPHNFTTKLFHTFRQNGSSKKHFLKKQTLEC